jgi:hypothetical protein
VIVVESIRNGEIEFRIETREPLVIHAERTSDGDAADRGVVGGSNVQVRHAAWLNITEKPERSDG